MDAHYYDLGSFRLECGVTLPRARLAYATHGTLNAERNNAILVASYYGGDHHGYDFVLGPGKALDPNTDYIILPEMFANGVSSSPSNSPPPFDGPRFPPINVRDNVEAAYRLLVDHLGITHLKAVAGASMGGQQVYQWAVSHPDFMDDIVAWVSAAKTYPHGFLMLEGAIQAITTDSAFMDGEYKSPPRKGLTASSIHWAAFNFSPEWWRKELFKPEFESVEDFIHKKAEDASGRDANDNISQCRTWQQHNIGNTLGFDGDHRQALRSIKARVLSMPCQTDWEFPIAEAEYEAQFISRLTYTPIDSPWGHLAGGAPTPREEEFLNKTIGEFLHR